MKKRLTLLSLLLLLFTMTAMAQTKVVGGIYYNLNESYNVAEVTNRTSGTKYSGDIVIPASISVDGVDYSVTSIGDYAFSDCSGLRSIEIPNSVTKIGAQAFLNCSGLRSIEIPNSVTSIGDYAFYGCSSLTSIEIPNSVTSIGSYAFYRCYDLTSIEIPNSVTSIGYGAFCDCSVLTSIVVEEGNSYYDSRENCNAIIETASNTLVAGCQNTVIPTSVTSIGERAFYNCSRLTSIEIPNSVTEIGDYAFWECSGLTSITMQRTTPPTVGDGLFFKCSKLETIYVPVGAGEAYNVAPWNKYNIVEVEVTGIESVTQEEWPADVYDLNGRMVKAQAENLDELPKGVYIVNGKKFVK